MNTNLQIAVGTIMMEVTKKFHIVAEQTKKEFGDTHTTRNYLANQYYLVMTGVTDARISDNFIHLASQVGCAMTDLKDFNKEHQTY